MATTTAIASKDQAEPSLTRLLTRSSGPPPPAQYAEHGIDYWQAYVAQTVRTYTKLAPEPRTQSGVTEVIEGNEVNNRTDHTRKTRAVLVLLDAGIVRESTTRPTAIGRRPLLPDGVAQRAQRLLRCRVQARGAHPKHK